MKFAKPLLILSAIASIGVLSGCNTEEPREAGTLAIMAYNGGYGDEWLETITEKFFEETGILVTYDTDSTILSKIENQLTGTSDYDIFMSHGLSWQNYASRDLLEPLDDLYSSENQDGDLFSSRVIPEALELAKYTNDSTGEEHYYKVPFTQGAGGFVYNVTMFEENGWNVPKTYSELVTLCETIYTDTSGGVTPFAWSSDRDYYWDYPIFSWWYELAGEETFDKWLSMQGSDGTYTSGIENFDPDGDYASFKQAFQMWYDLVALNSEYSNDNAYNASLFTAQDLFYDGKAAMFPYGQWAKKEIVLAQKRDFSFDVAMMKTPTVNASTTSNNFMVGFGDSMIIPKNSPNKEIAKQFLAFMSTEFACKAFVEEAEGPFLAFDYSSVDMSDLVASDTYIASLYDIINTSNNFSTASNNPLVVNIGDTFIQPWVNNVRYYKECSSNPSGTSVDACMDSLYASAQSSWTSWVRNSGVR